MASWKLTEILSFITSRFYARIQLLDKEKELTSSIPPRLSAEDETLFLELTKTTEQIDGHERIVFLQMCIHK